MVWNDTFPWPFTSALFAKFCSAALEEAWLFEIIPDRFRAVVDDPIARGRLPQPPWTVRQIHELRDLDDAGRRLRGPAGGSRHRNAMDAMLYLLPMLQSKS